MSDDVFFRMRTLRRFADRLNETLVEDYQPFYDDKNSTFVRLPERKDAKINVTPTCTALMALALRHELPRFYKPPEKRQDRLMNVLHAILDEAWDTGSMTANNAFTTSLVLRSAAVLGHEKELPSDAIVRLVRTRLDEEKEQNGSAPPAYRQFHSKNLTEICERLLDSAPESFEVQDYPASPTIAYWIVDAASLMRVSIGSDTASKAARWASTQFARQVSLVTANHHSMMDPVAMAMAACLCRSLRRISQYQKTMHKAVEELSPTDNELTAAIRLFFDKQNSAGVWEKYFPIFHYPASGPNHCWHFEVLEAVLNEFPELLHEIGILQKIENAVLWLERNRLAYRLDDKLFTGWTGGGDIKALRRGAPESWPTGVAHMFLTRLRIGLSRQIHLKVLEKYRDRLQVFRRKDREAWDDYLDSDLDGSIVNGDTSTVRRLLDSEILKPAEADIANQGIRYEGDVEDLPSALLPTFRLRRRMSALLFGPPGTSKTSLAEAVARRLGWPFIELSPSDFLRKGLEGIHHQVNEVFEDMSDLFGVVILFDEMDALVQSRDGAANQRPELDVTQKFLTTSMLPKLAKLHKEARVIYFMATNHIEEFDSAIKRAGRFDLLIPMGPPSVDEKIRGLQQEKSRWFREESVTERQLVHTRFVKWVEDPNTRQALQNFTFGEMGEFFDYLRRKYSTDSNLAKAFEAIESKKDPNFRELCLEHAKSIYLTGSTLKDFETSKKARIQ